MNTGTNALSSSSSSSSSRRLGRLGDQVVSVGRQVSWDTAVDAPVPDSVSTRPIEVQIAYHNMLRYMALFSEVWNRT